jgi:hypothetical protein
MLWHFKFVLQILTDMVQYNHISNKIDIIKRSKIVVFGQLKSFFDYNKIELWQRKIFLPFYNLKGGFNVKETTVFTKVFHDIGKLQKCRKIEYRLLSEKLDGQEVYGLKLVSESHAGQVEEYVKGISSCKDCVMDLLAFYYENAVTLENCREIAHDLLYKMNITI